VSGAAWSADTAATGEDGAPPPVLVHEGDGPVILGMPHVGTWLPDDIAARLTPAGRGLIDTDWHVDRLYEGLLPGATTVRATFHRYLIDANRPPDNTSLYPGQATTDLVPLTDFDGRPLWTTPPDAAEVDARRAAYHAPYHAALAAQVARVRARHGVAIVYDCHSIRSRVPRLFDGTLPDLNVGTAHGSTCDPRLAAAVVTRCRQARAYTSVVNGRFTGGWTTRHYGRPAEGVHAIQMELAQSTYLRSESAPFAYDERRASPLRVFLGELLRALAATADLLRPPR
jgi:N-formylglutamate deformylase